MNPKAPAPFHLAALAAAILAPVALSAAAEPEAIESLVPDDAIACVKFSGIGSAIDAFLASDVRREIEALPIAQAAKWHPAWFELERRLAEFRDATGKEPLEVARALLGREAVFAVRLGVFGPEVLAAARARDEAALEDAVAAVRKAAERAAGRTLPGLVTAHGDPPVPIETVEQVSFAKLGSTLVLSNSWATVQRAIDTARDGGRGSIARADGFRKALEPLPPGALATVVLRPRFLPDFRVPRAAESVPASLLFGGWLEALGSSEWIAAGAAASGGSLRIAISATPGSGPSDPGRSKALAAYFPEVPGDDLVQRLERRGILAAVELQRDFAAWWELRDRLLDAAGRSQLPQISGFVSVVSGGRDLGTEILPRLGQRLLLVARNQEYPGASERPRPAIPAFAAVFEIEGGSEVPDHAAMGFQTLAGFVNLDRAQKGQDPAKVEVERTEGVELHVLRLPASGGDAWIAANFSPSIAVAGGRLFLASSAELGRILVEEIGKARSAGGSTAAGDRLLLDGAALREVLSENKEAIAAEDARKKGISPEAAARELEQILGVLGLVGGLRAGSRKTGDSAVFELEVRFAGGGRDR
ncbi:MAG: hypothetical protein ACUVYA_00765 [Planctomycetota bacterium]